MSAESTWFLLKPLLSCIDTSTWPPSCPGLTSFPTECVRLMHFYKDTVSGEEPTPMASSHLHYLFKELFSQHSHILKYWVSSSHVDFKGHHSAHYSHCLRQLLTSCCSDKPYDQKIVWWGKGLFCSHIVVTVHHWGKSGRELEQEQRQEPWRKLLTGLLLYDLSFLSYTTHYHLTRSGPSESGLDHPISIQRENVPRNLTTANLKEAIPQFRVSLPRYL